MAVRQSPLTATAVIAPAAIDIRIREVVAERAVVDAVVRIDGTSAEDIAPAVGGDALALRARMTDFARAALFTRRTLTQAGRVRRRLVLVVLFGGLALPISAPFTVPLIVPDPLLSAEIAAVANRIAST